MAEDAGQNGERMLTKPRTAQSTKLMAETLAAATRLISERGFQGTTVRDLVDAIGLPKGTLYYHIGSKSELLHRINQHVQFEAISRWRAVLDEMVDEPATAVLTRLIHEHCKLVDEYRDWIAVFSEEMKFLSPEIQEGIRAKRVEYVAMFDEVLERVVRDGSFTESSIELRGRIILGMLNSMYRWYRADGRLSPAEVADIADSVVAMGVRAKL